MQREQLFQLLNVQMFQTAEFDNMSAQPLFCVAPLNPNNETPAASIPYHRSCVDRTDAIGD